MTTTRMHDEENNVEAGTGTEAELEPKTGNETETGEGSLLYGPDDVPPLRIFIPVAFQQTMANIAGIIFFGYIIGDIVCAEPDDPLRAKIVSTTLFMAGVCTALQSVFGIRLPIFQGPASAYIVPLIALQNTDAWQYQRPTITLLVLLISSSLFLIIFHTKTSFFSESHLQGSLITAALVETALGGFGLVGLVVRFVGPITVSVTTILISLTLVKVTAELCMASWPIAILSLALVVIFATYLRNIQTPIPTAISNRRLVITKVPLFKCLPVLLAAVISWLLCYILTATNQFSADPSAPGFAARTDAKKLVLSSTPWFYFPYPGQFGLPNFNTAVFIGFLAGVFSSIVESVGDYHIASNMCQAPPPPRHAINRGIFVEGLGSVLSGLYGAGHATTSYTVDIALISIIKVGSRYNTVGTGVLCIILASIGKFGAFLATIPEPVLGGQLIFSLGLMTIVGISTLRLVDLQSSRNLAILGVSLYTGLVVPNFIQNHSKTIDTGYVTLDQVITVILGTPMLIGAVISILLDNTVKGTDAMRGIRRTAVEEALRSKDAAGRPESVYEFPWLDKIITRHPFLTYLPFIQPQREKTWIV
ncbi:hypothetical protein ScPMuIL_005693 [Solemya velum]